MDDDNSMSERILRSLESIFNDDMNLKDFTIITTEDNTKNKSPVLYQEHCIGLESWCVKHIYRYVYVELFEVRNLLRHNRLPYCKERELNRLLIAALLINPDVSTFWNMKRELVESQVLSIHQELLFSKIVLSHKPKSNEAFAYRRWLLSRILSKIPAEDTVTPINLLSAELDVTEMAAEKSPHNYHAWTHRIWCMEKMLSRVGDTNRFIFNEIDFTHKWLQAHLSEYCGYHYRQYIVEIVRTCKSRPCLPQYCPAIQDRGLLDHGRVLKLDLEHLLNLRKYSEQTVEGSVTFDEFFSLLLFDLEIITLQDQVFPNHESLWYHHRFIIYKFLTIIFKYHGLCTRPKMKIDDSRSRLSDSSGIDSNLMVFKAVNNDKHFIPNFVEQSPLYGLLRQLEWQFMQRYCNGRRGDTRIELIQRHVKWIKFVTGMESGLNF